MSPHSTAHKLLNELKSRLSTERDPLTKALLEDKIKSTSQILIRESVKISLARDQQTRSFGLTHREAPIKCGLRGATGHSLPDKTRHWFWDNMSEKDAKKLEKTRKKIKELLFHDADKALVRKFVLMGGVRKCLKEIGLPAILDLPENVRREKAPLIIKLIEDKLNGPEKLPFC